MMRTAAEIGGNPLCICLYERVPDEVFGDGQPHEIYTTSNDPCCPLHGEGTRYWRRLQETAKALSEGVTEGLDGAQIAERLKTEGEP